MQSPAYELSVASLRRIEDCSRYEYKSVPQHSSVATVAEVVRLAREHRADGFIAIGGGSVSDTAKAAALWLAESGNLEDHATHFTPPNTLVAPQLAAPKLPIVAVPCTASGAEVTSSAGIRAAEGRKLIFSDSKLAARLIVIDPLANISVPASIMLATGMNGLAHCIEGRYSKQRTPITDALARHAIDLFATALPQVAREPQSVEHRASLLTAAHLSGLVLVNARTCLHHAICHAIGAVTGVAHGDANSVILPHAMQFNHEWLDNAFTIVAVRALQATLRVPTRMRDIGVRRDAIGTIAAKVMSERGLYFNPRPVRDVDEIMALLEAAW